MAVLGPIAGPTANVRRGPFPHVVSPPSGLGWTPAFDIIELFPGVFTTSIVTAALKPSTATIRYVDVATGADGNTGLVAGSPKKSIWSAIIVGANDTVYIKGSANPATPTIYNDDHAWNSVPIQACNFIVVSDFTTLAPGYAISSTAMPESGTLLGAWSLVGGGTPNTWTATLAAAPHTVIDATVTNATTGAPTKQTLQASVAAVEAAPGSYYWAAGSVYVRTTDSRRPDVNLRVLRASRINGWLNTAINLYVERLSFEGGGSRAFYIQNCATAAFVDCNFTLAENNGLELNASGAVTGLTHTIYAIRCAARGNTGDGFGSTVAGATETVRFVEIGCTYAGNNGSGSDEGSSHHFTAGNTAVSCIRVNGAFRSNKTDGFADVGGTTTWALGCRFTGEAIGAYVGDTGTAWLQGCVFNGCTVDLDPFDAGATINVSNSTYATRAGSGTVQGYAP